MSALTPMTLTTYDGLRLHPNPRPRAMPANF